MATLFLMCGLPGAGKSTLAQKMASMMKNTEVISRDKIRFSIVKEDEEYFSHEKEVQRMFWNHINDALADGKNVIADQTSLDLKSRECFIKHVKGYSKLKIIFVMATVENCLKRNENRKGTRAYVPIDVINNMYFKLIPPEKDNDTDKKFDEIYWIECL